MRPSRSMLFVDSACEAAEGADAPLVLTEWDEFKHLDYARIRRSFHHQIIVDGRNLLSPEEMRKLDFNYLSIEWPDVIPSEVSRQASGRQVVFAIIHREMSCL